MLTFSHTDTVEKLLTVYDLEIGDTFKYTDDVDSLINRIYENRPENLLDFSVVVVRPGTATFALHGNCVMVIDK